MKKIISAAALLGVSAISAQAADLPARTYTKAPMAAPVMAYNWTGCYIGGNGGGAWARTSQTQIAKVGGPAIIPNNDFGSSDRSNGTGGGQIGCDYRFSGNWLVGVQVMGDYANIRSSHVVPTAFPGFPVGSFVSNNRLQYTVTATGRIGYVFAPQVLAYVKGGGAWAEVDHNFIGTVPVTFLSESANNVSRQGYTVGGGLEWMFAPGWSVFGEYNYLDFGRKNINFTQGPGTVGLPDVVRTRLEVQQGLVGVNYKFNWGGPVVARY